MVTKQEKKNIGFGINAPTSSCSGDKHCPFHGNAANIRGRRLSGKVIRAKVQKNALIEIERKTYVPKYERYTRARTRLTVHSPSCIDAKVGDIVTLYETRKISKTKNFVIVAKETALQGKQPVS